MDAQKPSSRQSFRRKKQLQQDLDHVTQEMYKRNLELSETNQLLSLLRAIDTLVLESHDELRVLCQSIASSVVKNSNFVCVGIMAIPERREKLELLGLSSSFDGLMAQDYPATISSGHSWIVGPEKQKLVSLDALNDEQIANLLSVEVGDFQKLRQKVPIKSVSVVKLLSRHRIVGVMFVGFVEPDSAITDKQTAIIDRLSEAIGIAIDNNLLFNENQYVLGKLQKTNAKLEALDEAKDEFISMASHQLRTPLTSVKGYLSMLAEGDAGKLSPAQEKFVTQSFTSAQRMVYLISDLLNVSRLKTGKFIIEPVPSYLPDVVQQEVEQQKESAKAKEIELHYEKPTKFPTLNLDETKLRQVVMNFIDNAIYYTPSGGQIKIALSATENSIEYAVTDNGIGVPKHEQHHLFTKFYRAENARKARPDGTGLGLFMAKKVIIASGGALIFKSEENKGSTFGFSFPLHKLKNTGVK